MKCFDLVKEFFTQFKTDRWRNRAGVTPDTTTSPDIVTRAPSGVDRTVTSPDVVPCALERDGIDTVIKTAVKILFNVIALR